MNPSEYIENTRENDDQKMKYSNKKSAKPEEI